MKIVVNYKHPYWSVQNKQTAIWDEIRIDNFSWILCYQTLSFPHSKHGRINNSIKLSSKNSSDEW